VIVHDQPSAVAPLETQRRAEPHIDSRANLEPAGDMAERMAERHDLAAGDVDIVILPSRSLVKRREPLFCAPSRKRLAITTQRSNHVEYDHILRDAPDDALDVAGVHRRGACVDDLADQRLRFGNHGINRRQSAPLQPR